MTTVHKFPLAKKLGYRPAKMWGATFKGLLAEPAKEKA